MRWTIKPIPAQVDIKRLSEALKVSPIIAQLLLQRDIRSYDEAKKFFRPQLSDLHDPFLMKDMDKAVARIKKAMADNENILVFGDYDVDGTTAVALVSNFLQERHPNVATYIPDRYSEGYGISKQGIDFADDNGFSLIIALDCGIKAIDKVAYAKKLGIDFIICDHHTPASKLPKAIAVLDPKRKDCQYPYKELCGCGVGFKLIQALASLNDETAHDLLPYLDLVATAIGADIVPITGENRVLAYFGLQAMNSNPRIGFQAIINQTKKTKLNITDVVFILAPRINAAGRMEHGQIAVNLLTAKNLAEAQRIAVEIEQYNLNRRNLDEQITKEALHQIKANKEEERYSTVVFDKSWHKGVIGIVASRLTESYHRPTLVFTKSGDQLAASARSIKGFDVYEALKACSDHIKQFGGHKYAAGLTLLESEYQKFKDQFEAVVSETIDKELMTPEITVDAKIEFAEITPKTSRIINQFAPFGPGNMRPVFLAENVSDTGYARKVGQDEKHLKLAVAQKASKPIDAIGFNLAHKWSLVKNRQKIDMVFTLDENEWNGTVSIQLKVKDLK